MTTPAPSVTDDVFEQFRTIDKALAHAQAALALNLLREVFEQVVRAHQLSTSLMFRLESERILPDTSSPSTTGNGTATEPAPEQAVLL